MPENVIVIDKKPGQTPLECVNEVKIAHPEWNHIPMTYAGRLDPLASGVLLILTGDECLKKDEYMALPKEYEVTILFGFATDTYDVMGKVVNIAKYLGSPVEEYPQGEVDGLMHPPRLLATPQEGNKIQDVLSRFTGRIAQAYPPYSSRTVDGKPLFQWAREGKLDEITIPSHDVFVESINIVESNVVSGSELYTYIKTAIANVKGDFRQTEILDIWAEILGAQKNTQFQTMTVRISCGSGVYVRSIAHELGIALGVPALALNIIRTRIGDYTI